MTQSYRGQTAVCAPSTHLQTAVVGCHQYKKEAAPEPTAAAPWTAHQLVTKTRHFPQHVVYGRLYIP